MRWNWICVGLPVLAACSHEKSAPTEVETQVAALSASAATTQASASPLPSAVPSGRYCKPTAPETSSARAARPESPAASPFDGDRAQTRAERERADRVASEATAKSDVADADRKEADRLQARPVPLAAQAAAARAAAEQRQKEAAFERAYAAEESNLAALPPADRGNAYAALKARHLGGAQ